MKLGFVSAILPDRSLEEVLRFASESGYSCVELMCWPRGKAERRYAGVTHLDVATIDHDEVKRIRALLDVHRVGISALGYYPNPLSPDALESSTVIDHLKKVITAARLLDVPVVNTFVGRDWRRSVEDNWPRFLDVWRDLIRFAEDQGIKVAIENCPMLFSKDEWPGGKNLATTPSIWRRMFSDIPSKHFGLNYDPSHLVWQRIDHLRPLREFAPRIFHVHAKDCHVDTNRLDDVGILATPLEFHSPKLPGLGDIDWGRFLSGLGDLGYQGPVCVEVEDRAYEGSLATRESALRQSYRHLTQYMP